MAEPRKMRGAVRDRTGTRGKPGWHVSPKPEQVDEVSVSTIDLSRPVIGSNVLRGVQPGLTGHTYWIQSLTDSWNTTRQPSSIEEELYEYLCTTNNYYKTGLYLTYKSPGFATNKGNSLSIVILKLFNKWLHSNKKVAVLDQSVKDHAFEVAMAQKNTTLTELIFKVFQITDEPHLFIKYIRYFIQQKKYKEACVCTTVLKLQNHFDIKEMIIPLTFQDCLNAVESYLQNCKQQQDEFLRFIDGLSSQNVNTIRATIDEMEIPGVRPEKCQPRILKKLAARCMKMWGTSQDVCPNVSQSKNTGALKYLLYKKYIERHLDEEDWDELVQCAVGEDVALQNELVMSLTCYNDIACAIKYAEKYSLPHTDLPISVQQALKDKRRNFNSGVAEFKAQHTKTRGSQNCKDVQNDTWDCDTQVEDYHTLSLPGTSIIFIDNRTYFFECLNHITKCSSLGIDGEWKPTFGLQQQRLAVLQIATPESVYIFDFIQLTEVLSPNDWLLFVQGTFCNPNIIKLGFGICADLKMISQSLPDVAASAMGSCVSVLDLSSLSELLLRSHPEIFPYLVCDGGKGLADLVKACFGKPLDKKDQFSNWERRPLKSSQVLYAALDAFCLLEISNILTRRAMDLGIDFASLTKSVLSPAKAKVKKNTKPTKPTEVKQVPINNVPLAPGDLAVVVDTMLQGLGRQLRMFGVDVKILHQDDDHREALNISHRENRIILTTGAPYAKLSQYVPEGMCVNVSIAPAKQQAAEVFHRFNVQVKQDDIFSRCQVCNNSRYITVASEDMKSMWRQHSQVKSSRSDFPNLRPFDGGSIDVNSLVTDDGGKLNFDGVSDSLFERVEAFYVCSKCGKVYWIGSHFRNVVKSLDGMTLSE